MRESFPALFSSFYNGIFGQFKDKLKEQFNETICKELQGVLKHLDKNVAAHPGNTTGLYFLFAVLQATMLDVSFQGESVPWLKGSVELEGSVIYLILKKIFPLLLLAFFLQLLFC